MTAPFFIKIRSASAQSMTSSALDIAEYIENKTFSKTWDNIETVEPDEIDLQMQHDIENDPDCKEFLSADEAMLQRKLILTI